MVPVVDNYFATRFIKILRAILRSVDDEDSEPYLIDEVLRGYSSKDKDAFKKAFAIKQTASQADKEKKLPIDVRFSYPTDPQQTVACYAITRGTVNEEDFFIGNAQNNSSELGREDSYEGVSSNEGGAVEKDEIGYFVRTKAPILQMLSINEMDATYLDEDNFTVGDNKFRITSNLNDMFLGSLVHVTYVKQDTGSHKDYASKVNGYSVTEELNIATLSNNATTVRELDSLLKFILVYMRDDGVESNFYRNARVKSDAMDIVSFSEDSPDYIYRISTTLTYGTDYTVSKDSATRIKNIMLNFESDNKKGKTNG